jgi:hypothetical protein
MLTSNLGFITGQALAGLFARSIGKAKFQVMAAFTIGGILLGCKFSYTATPFHAAQLF